MLGYTFSHDLEPDLCGDTFFISMVKKVDVSKMHPCPSILYDLERYYREVNWKFERQFDRKISRIRANYLNNNIQATFSREITGEYAARLEDALLKESSLLHSNMTYFLDIADRPLEGKHLQISVHSSPESPSFASISYLFDELDRDSSLLYVDVNDRVQGIDLTASEWDFAYALDLDDRVKRAEHDAQSCLPCWIFNLPLIHKRIVSLGSWMRWIRVCKF